MLFFEMIGHVARYSCYAESRTQYYCEDATIPCSQRLLGGQNAEELKTCNKLQVDMKLGFTSLCKYEELLYKKL